MFLAKKLNDGAGSPVVPADAQFNYVTMLLHGDGTNGAQNNTFLDSSASPLTITRNGNTTQGSFSPYGSNWSNYFSDGAYLSVPNNAVFNPGSGDFTVESMFCRTINTGGSQTIIAKYESGWQSSFSVIISGDTWDVNITYGVGSYALVYSGPAPAVGVWSHFVLQRNGSFWEFYCNGVRLAQVTAYTIASTTSAIRIGELGSGYSGYSFNGYISNVRIRNGYATYSGATYTVPTANLTAIVGTALLTCQSNRFVDNSSNNFAVTPGTVSTGRPSVQRFNPFGTSTAYSTSVIGGSGIFASGNWLDVPANSALSFTGDFTVECWVYQTERGFNGVVTEIGEYTDGVMIRVGSGTTYDTIYINNINIGGISTYVPLNSWTHIAVVRSGTNVTVYVNGVSRLTSTVSGTVNGAVAGTRIGAPRHTTGSAQPFNGYISNLRVVKGTAVYTANFTLSTAPVTAITNTSLLTNMTNAAIFDNAMMNDLETVGNAQISTSVVKYGTGSLAFDGTGDYLKTPATNLNVGFGTGDFTVEFWIYFNSVSGVRKIYDNYNGNNNPNAAITLGNPTSGRMQWYAGQTQVLQTTTTFTTGIWYHVAISRSSGTSRIFVNGTQEASASDTRTYAVGNANIAIGAEISTSLYSVDGYIDDFRITYGYARYTANFTPPTAAFPNNN